MTPYPELLAESAAVVVATAVFWRSRFKYGARAYRFALLEAGHLGQSLLLAAAALDVATTPVGGFSTGSWTRSSTSTASTRPRSTSSRLEGRHDRARPPRRLGGLGALAALVAPSVVPLLALGLLAPLLGVAAGTLLFAALARRRLATANFAARCGRRLAVRGVVLGVKSFQEEAIWRALLLGALVGPLGRGGALAPRPCCSPPRISAGKVAGA